LAAKDKTPDGIETRNQKHHYADGSLLHRAATIDYIEEKRSVEKDYESGPTGVEGLSTLEFGSG
jgi:hypothetical protein